MKFWEAMKALQEGKSVRCKDWGEGAYWSFTNPGSLWATLNDIFNLCCREWELYEEPEKTFRFVDLLPQIKNGKTVKRKSGEIRVNQRVSDSCFYSYNFSKQAVDIDTFWARTWTPTIEDLEADDWIEVRE